MCPSCPYLAECPLHNRIEALESDTRDIPTIAYLSGAHDHKQALRKATAHIIALEWLVEVQDFCWFNDAEDTQPINDDATDELHATWQAALAAAKVR